MNARMRPAFCCHLAGEGRVLCASKTATFNFYRYSSRRTQWGNHACKRDRRHKSNNNIYSDDLITSLTGLNKSVEECVTDIPEQYQWEYKRFKQDPSGKKKIRYKKLG